LAKYGPQSVLSNTYSYIVRPDDIVCSDNGLIFSDSVVYLTMLLIARIIKIVLKDKLGNSRGIQFYQYIKALFYAHLLYTFLL